MKLLIDGRDYTGGLDASDALSIERRFNEPAVCRIRLSLRVSGGLTQPMRNQSVAVLGDDGTSYFSGYLASSPLAEYAGMGLEGAFYRITLEAISGDQLTSATVTGSRRKNALTLAPTVYRGATGALVWGAATGVVHDLDENAGALTQPGGVWTAARTRATCSDFTVCGEVEPTAYVTEFLLGDGATSQFFLSGKPFMQAASRETVIDEQFNESELDGSQWSNTGSPGYLQIGAGGLVMQGGRGTDGTTALSWVDPVEMGGTLLLEAVGVSLQAGSAGIVPGFFSGGLAQSSCTAGFQATADPGTGNVTLQPIVLGVGSGGTFAVDAAHQYTLRIRIHCSENQRSLSIFRAYDGTTLNSYGGETNQCPGRVMLEVQEFVDGVGGMPVVLYEGSIANLPPVCTLVAASSNSLQGAVRSLHLKSLGSGWVTTTPTGGGPSSRRIGTLAESAECQIDGAGKLAFFPGFTPGAGTLITVSYRASGRAAGRALNSTAQTAPVSAWEGTVTSPVARSSQDCRNAAQALADAASDGSNLWRGSCRVVGKSLASDVQPGDAIKLNASSADYAALVVVRNVVIKYKASYPDVFEYSLDFANDWADGISLAATESVPADAQLPVAAGLAVLPNLNNLSVTSMSGGQLTVDAGTMAPAGGGFEVRRRDNAFGSGAGADFVMQSTTPAMSFARVSVTDRFFIRMYDGATPPNYSEFSGALVFNVPLGA